MLFRSYVPPTTHPCPPLPIPSFSISLLPPLSATTSPLSGRPQLQPWAFTVVRRADPQQLPPPIVAAALPLRGRRCPSIHHPLAVACANVTHPLLPLRCCTAPVQSRPSVALPGPLSPCAPAHPPRVSRAAAARGRLSLLPLIVCAFSGHRHSRWQLATPAVACLPSVCGAPHLPPLSTPPFPMDAGLPGVLRNLPAYNLALSSALDLDGGRGGGSRGRCDRVGTGTCRGVRIICSPVVSAAAGSRQSDFLCLYEVTFIGRLLDRMTLSWPPIASLSPIMEVAYWCFHGTCRIPMLLRRAVLCQG